MLMKKIAALVGACLFSTQAFAFKVVDSECNDQAKLGAWTVGIGEKKNVNIAKEFAGEHQMLVQALDRLPVKLSEEALFAGIGSKPNNVIRVMKDHARFQWDMTGKKSSVNVIVQYYKGCIDQISVMDSRSMAFYNRHNILADKK